MNHVNNPGKRETFVSLVVLASKLHDDEDLEFLEKAAATLHGSYDDFEIIIVEDVKGAVERSKLDRLLKRIESIRFLVLAYSVYGELALTIGLENAIGDFVVLFNPQQDPLSVVDDLISLGLDNHPVVVGVAANARRGLLYRVVRPMAEAILRRIGYHVPRHATTLRCLSREAIQAATRGRNYHHRLLMRISQCGLEATPYEYDVLNPKFAARSLMDGTRDALRILVLNSTAPLRLMSIVGFTGSLFAFLFATYSFLSKLLKDNVAEGWSSLVIFMSFLFMLLFMMMSFFGEYLGRLLSEQSPHEPYWVIGEKVSSVMLKTDRRNVTEMETDRGPAAASPTGS